MRFDLDQLELQKVEERHCRYSKTAGLELSCFQNCQKIPCSICLGWCWKLRLSYVFSIMVFPSCPTFSREAVDTRFVWNWMAIRLWESWGLTNENCWSCWGNTERIILYAPSVRRTKETENNRCMGVTLTILFLFLKEKIVSAKRWIEKLKFCSFNTFSAIRLIHGSQWKNWTPLLCFNQMDYLLILHIVLLRFAQGLARWLVPRRSYTQFPEGSEIGQRTYDRSENGSGQGQSITLSLVLIFIFSFEPIETNKSNLQHFTCMLNLWKPQ